MVFENFIKVCDQVVRRAIISGVIIKIHIWVICPKKHSVWENYINCSCYVCAITSNIIITINLYRYNSGIQLHASIPRDTVGNVDRTEYIIVLLWGIATGHYKNNKSLFLSSGTQI